MKRDCLSAEELNRVMDGRLPADEFDSALSHLDHCDSCRTAAETIQQQSDPTREDASKFAEPDPIQNETACQVALQKILHQEPSPPPSASLPFDSLGPYQLLDLIGSGGMGAVYLAQHQRLKRRCAIKLLPPERVTQTGWLDRFDREMTTIASLEHPNVVRATDAGHESGWHYLVMEHLDGLDVGRVARRIERLEVADACEIVRQAALGLAHIHESGLVHRDIKPSNLMLTRDGRVKLLDLGLVLAGDDPLSMDERLTTVGHVMGTMPYMAPEQLADSRSVSPQSDIYALGATLFRLISGRPPHQSSRGLAAQAIAITNTDAIPLDSIREDVDRDVVEFVSELLSRDPSERPQSASDVAKRLEQFASGSQLKTLLRTALRKHDDQEATAALYPSVVAGGSTGRLRDWFIGAAAAALLLIAAIVVRIETDRGDLIIHSEHDDLAVLVKQGDQTVDRITVEAGEENRIRLRKGSYDIEIEGGGEALVLSDEVVTISRGTEQKVSVIEPAQPEAIRPNPSDNQPEPAMGPVIADTGETMIDPASQPGYVAEPSHNGKSLTQWLKIVETGEDIDEVGDAMNACIQSLENFGPFYSGSEHNGRIIKTILERARKDGGARSELPPLLRSEERKGSRANYFTWYLQQIFPQPDLTTWLDLFSEELVYGTGQSRAATLHCVHRYLVAYSGSRQYLNDVPKYTISRIVRACVSLATDTDDDSNWGDLSETDRQTAADNAYHVVVLIGQHMGFEPNTHPEFAELIRQRPTSSLSQWEQMWLLDNGEIIESKPAREGLPQAEPRPSTSKMAAAPENEPVFQGRVLSQWLSELDRERDVNTLAEIMRAVEFLSRDADPETRRTAAMKAAKTSRIFGGIISGGKEDPDPSHRFMASFLEIFPRFMPGEGIDAVSVELAEGNDNSKMATVWALQQYLSGSTPSGVTVQPDHSFAAWALRISDDETAVERYLGLRDQLIELAAAWKTSDVAGATQSEMLRAAAAQTALTSAFQLNLAFRTENVLDERLVRYILEKLKSAMRSSNGLYAELPLTEDELFAIADISKTQPDKITTDMWKHVVNSLLSNSYTVKSERTKAVFDTIAKRLTPEELVPLIDNRLRVGGGDITMFGQETTPVQMALAYYLAHAKDKAKAMDTLRMFEAGSPYLSETTKSLVEDIKSALTARMGTPDELEAAPEN